MNVLLKELEALEISGDFSQDNLWSTCIDLVQKSYVPEKTVGASRPFEEKDFREYRQIVDRNLGGIRSMLQHIIYNHNERNVQIDLNIPAIRTFAINLLLLIGEHHEKSIWNTTESVSIAKELLDGLLKLYRCQSVSQFLTEQDNFTIVLLTLRPKLLKDTWKAYPAAVASYKWLLYQIEVGRIHQSIRMKMYIKICTFSFRNQVYIIISAMFFQQL